MEPPTVREVTKRLRKEGWKLEGCRGDHWKYSKAGSVVIVPGKMSDRLKPGTWASIRRRAGW